MTTPTNPASSDDEQTIHDFYARSQMCSEVTLHGDLARKIADIAIRAWEATRPTPPSQPAGVSAARIAALERVRDAAEHVLNQCYSTGHSPHKPDVSGLAAAIAASKGTT